MSVNIEINSRTDFVVWAIERAQEIVGEQGSYLALAARAANENAIQDAANALGSAIAEALLEVFESLLAESQVTKNVCSSQNGIRNMAPRRKMRDQKI